MSELGFNNTLGKKYPEWLNKAVFYQIYPQSFYDSNGDGIGDLNGIILKLDYIQRLGANAIWLNPCFVSPFKDAGYDVADYYRVAPRYGSNTDLRRLVWETHHRGLRVCLDLVPAHTSIEHPWFIASCRAERNKYSHWFIWTDSVWSGADRFIRGFAGRNGNYLPNFFYSQPALNYGFANPAPEHPWEQRVDAPGPRAVHRELERIMRFWLRAGVDGFRVDMASSLVKKDQNGKATSALWQDLKTRLEKDYPNMVLIAEWCNPTTAIRAGFHVDFMIHCGVPGYPALFFNEKGAWPYKNCFFDRRGKGNVLAFLREYEKHYNVVRGRGFIALPSGNHDFQRPNTFRTEKELKVIFAFLLTWPGVPFIYYGDEIGMRYLPGLPSKEGGYNRTGARTPMQWGRGANAGFSTAPSGKLYLPVDPSSKRPNVADQTKKKDSLLNHVRRLLSLRKEISALGNEAEMVPLYAEEKKYPFMYLRSSRSEKMLIAVNPAGRPASVKLPRIIKNARLIYGEVQMNKSRKNCAFECPPVSFGIFKVS